MSREESLYPKDWLRIAEKDLKRVDTLLADHDPEMAGFCLQQAAEKSLKAFLLSKGWELRRIHSLDALLDDAVVYHPVLEGFRTVCQKVSAFYFVERYPIIVETNITEDDVKSSKEQLKGLIEQLREEIVR